MYYERLMQVTGLTKQAGIDPKLLLLLAGLGVGAPAALGTHNNIRRAKAEAHEGTRLNGETGFFNSIGNNAKGLLRGLGATIAHPIDTFGSGLGSIIRPGGEEHAAIVEGIEKAREAMGK